MNFILMILSLGLLCNAGEIRNSAQILHEIRSLGETGSVLLVGAHPDDENNQLLAYLVQGRGYRTGYLSVTRGEGGQNLIGSEQGESLGVLRTQELLAARRIDGAQQFFTSAIDFGFTKDYRDSFKFWDKQRVLGEIVRVIRMFRPDVIVTRFSPEPGNTHGHHTASAMLSYEAFGLVGDPRAYPEQLTSLSPWQPKRILWNVGIGFSGGTTPDTSLLIPLEVGGYDPILGESYGEIGTHSRSMHRSQGMGKSISRGKKTEYFKVLAGAPAQREILEGIDTSWGRFRDGSKVQRLIDGLVEKYNPTDPSGSIPQLLKVLDALSALPQDIVAITKIHQLSEILKASLGLYVETIVDNNNVIRGDTLNLKHSASIRSNQRVIWRGVRYPSVKRDVSDSIPLFVNQTASREFSQVLPIDVPMSQPYWLREKGSPGMYAVPDTSLLGRPENPPVFPVEDIFEIDGRAFTIDDDVVQIYVDPAKGEVRKPLQVVAPVQMNFNHDLELFSPGATKSVSVEIISHRPSIHGTLKFGLPSQWKIKPEKKNFKLSSVGAGTQFTFSITAPVKRTSETITVQAVIDGVTYSPATLKVVSLPLKIAGSRVGYLPGTGDLVVDCLMRMGYNVTILRENDLVPEILKKLDAVVVGVRAFNVRSGLDRRLPALFDFVKAGGRVVMQYNTPDNLQTTHFAPFNLTLSNDRVTDPNAAVTFLDPRSPVLKTPNKITAADFEAWVQERGRNFPSSWDSHFIPILSFNDTTGASKPGSLLVAKYGSGYFIYTGLSFFRELPEGVPGAFRLFANLL